MAEGRASSTGVLTKLNDDIWKADFPVPKIIRLLNYHFVGVVEGVQYTPFSLRNWVLQKLFICGQAKSSKMIRRVARRIWTCNYDR